LMNFEKSILYVHFAVSIKQALLIVPWQPRCSPISHT
jgi:hypothetical protein